MDSETQKSLMNSLKESSRKLLDAHLKAQLQLEKRVTRVEVIAEIIEELADVDYFYGPDEIMRILNEKIDKLDV